MINLLPPDYKSSLLAGHQNTVMRRWLVLLLVACLGLAVIIGVGWLYIDQQNRNLNHNISSLNQQLQAQNLSDTQSQAKTISANIKVIDQVLSREIRFSDLIQQIGSVMPPGTVLSGLTLTSIDGALDLAANAHDYTSAAQIAANLSDPANKLFNKVDFVSLNCQTSSTNPYPCSANFKALFNPTTKNRFLNVPGGSK